MEPKSRLQKVQENRTKVAKALAILERQRRLKLRMWTQPITR